MIPDKDLTFSWRQAPGNTGANDSTNHVDLGAGPGDAREQLTLVVSISADIAASGGAAGIAFALQEASDDSTFAATVPPIGRAEIAKASLTAGTEVLRIKLPYNLKRYLKLVYTVGTNNITSGTIDAFLVRDAQSQ